MLQLQPGEDLISTLEALGLQSGWAEAYVSGTGQLELVELAAEGGATTLERAVLTGLSGRVRREGARCVATLAVSVIADGRLHAGRVVAAVSGDLLLVVDAVPLAAAAAVAGAPATDPAEGPRPATAPLSATFSRKPMIARRQSASPLEDEEDEPNPMVALGELLNHPQLGLCEVVGDDASGGTRVRMSSGRVATLKLDSLRVLPAQPDEQGRSVYKIVGPRRRNGP